MSPTPQRPEHRRFDIAIIGGGFTGACLASHLLSRADRPLSVVLIERGQGRARGTAYGTQDWAHLLNVSTDNMSAWEDDPEHFLRWARLNFDSDVQAEDFLPRRLYGQYLEAVLQESAQSRPDQFLWKVDEAVHINRTTGTSVLGLRSGETICADKVVLALGNFPPADLRLPGDQDRSLLVPNPWAGDALDSIPRNASVLLVGSGLTSVDMVLALREREFHGTIHLLSRHGLLPQAHTKTTNEDCDKSGKSFWDHHSPRTALGLTRLIREQVHAAEARGGDWREVVDSLRACTPAIWQSLPLVEQRRFLRHLRPFWDAHRHRIAPQIARILDHQMLDGRIQTHAGRITEYRERHGRAEITYRDRCKGVLKRLEVDRVINCTGPQADCRKLASPLLADLMRQGLARPDPLSLGLDTAENGAVLDARAAPRIFSIPRARRARETYGKVSRCLSFASRSPNWRLYCWLLLLRAARLQNLPRPLCIFRPSDRKIYSACLLTFSSTPRHASVINNDEPP